MIQALFLVYAVSVLACFVLAVMCVFAIWELVKSLFSKSEPVHYCQVCNAEFRGDSAYSLSEICTYRHCDSNSE